MFKTIGVSTNKLYICYQGLSFKIAPGETVALVGPSGGGKSTVISLLERFYDPVQGTISIGDIGIPSLDVSWYRQKLALVSQEPVLFATTIADNIAYGREARQEEVRLSYLIPYLRSHEIQIQGCLKINILFLSEKSIQ